MHTYVHITVLHTHTHIARHAHVRVFVHVQVRGRSIYFTLISHVPQIEEERKYRKKK